MLEHMLLSYVTPPPPPGVLRFKVNAGTQEKVTVYFKNAKGVITLQDGSKQSYEYAAETPREITIPPMAGEIAIAVEPTTDVSSVNFSGSNMRITEVLEWSSVSPKVNFRLFGLKGLVKVPLQAPTSSSLYALFTNCVSFNQDLSMWDTSHITKMAMLFGGCDVYNKSIKNWNISKVTNIDFMFQNCVAYNQDLSTMVFKSTVSRSNYDANTFAWNAVYKPKFTG